MKKLKMKTQCRHGDVLIERTDALPANAKYSGKGNIVLAEGTATGHKHVMIGNVESFSDGTVMFLQVGSAELTHEEHATVVFGKGVYRVLRQVEYGADKAARQVAD